MSFFRIIFTLLGILFLSACNSDKTPPLSITPSAPEKICNDPDKSECLQSETLPKKTCSDLSETECPQAETLIQVKCTWNGKKCAEYIKLAVDLNRCKGLNQQECAQAIVAHGKCIWRENLCITKPSESENLTYHLKAWNVETKVTELAKIGIENYKKPPLLAAREQAKNTNTTGGGRSGNWIIETFGKSEAQIITELKGTSPLSTWNLSSIDEAFLAAKKKTPPQGTTLPTFFLVKGLSVNYLHDYPQGKNAILQLASQFNFLESVSTSKTNVSNYLGDYTQGPQGSIEAAAAALHRTALEGEGKLNHALHDVFSGTTSAYYKNGYFEPHNISEAEQLNLLAHIKANINKMTILPQWVTCEASDSRQLQVFSAAPSYQGASAPIPGSPGAQLCDELVSAQYEAIAKLAVIRNVSTGLEVPVHFTLVGQGAFNNPASVMTSSFRKVAQVVKGYDQVKVYIHGYGPQDQAKIRAAVDAASFTLQDLTKEEFQALP